MSTMQPGHENCSYATIEERSLTTGENSVQAIVCRHDHREEVHADEASGDGLLIGWHCRCCNRIIRLQDI